MSEPRSKRLKQAVKRHAQRALRHVGLMDPPTPPPLPYGFEEEELATYAEAGPFTMTGHRRVLALIWAVRYVVKHAVPGDIVECGVWRGGSMMAVARTLQHLGDINRTLYLYDTFNGMVAPTSEDVTVHDIEAGPYYEARKRGDGSDWCHAGLADVQANLTRTGYPTDLVRFVEGKVEDTILHTKPDRVALLRLDTDFYESTKCELDHLYPRLTTGGILIVDDYLYWRGARQAVDEYLTANRIPIFFVPVDGGAVIGVKP